MTDYGDLTYEEQIGWTLAFEHIRGELAHHLTWTDDPCQDRGVNWPCDVARALAQDRFPVGE